MQWELIPRCSDIYIRGLELITISEVIIYTFEEWRERRYFITQTYCFFRSHLQVNER